MRQPARYPAFLSVDVEPNGFQLGREGPAAWSGFEAMADFVEDLRPRLGSVSGDAPTIGWYYRLDPQIAAAFGRPDYAVHAFGTLVDAQRTRGDYFGIHAHPVRWCDERRTWIHDFADQQFTAECTRRTAEAFADAFGSTARRHRYGAGLMNDAIVAEAERVGVEVDLSLEPATTPRRDTVFSGSDSTPVAGELEDLSASPRAVYRPDVADFRVARNRAGRRITLVPMSATRWDPRHTPWPKRVARHVLRRRPRTRILYPSVPWPSPQLFWDLAQRELRSMKRPYLSLALRTDDPNSLQARRVREIFESLPDHPIAARLRFVDPLEVVGELLPAR